MGEYAKFNNDSIKIGTCEEMYYLRYDQRHLVQYERGSVDLEDKETLAQVRFRFPFPSEDNIMPGGFSDHTYGIRVPDAYDMSDGLDHSLVQFRASNGYLTNLPCPESTEWIDHAGYKLHNQTAIKVHLNGYGGKAKLVQQKYVNGQLWAVCACCGCGTKWRLDQDSGMALADSFTAEAAKMERQGLRNWADYREIATRIRAGYLTA
jgi:hypothetical protein